MFHVQLLLLCLSLFHVLCFTWAVSLSCTAARWPSTHAVEFCHVVFVRGTCEPHCGAVFLLNTVRPPVSISLAVFRLLLNDSRLPCLFCPGLPVLPVRQSLQALCASPATVLCLLEPPVWSFSSFAVVFVEPSCSFSLHHLRCCLEHLYQLLGHTLLLLSVLVQAVLRNVSSAASGRCSRISQSRGVVEGLVCFPSEPCPSATLRATPSFFLNVVPTCLTSPSSPRVCLAHFAVSPAVDVSRAAQTFCHIRDAWLLLLSRRNVLLVLHLVLRFVDASRDVITAAARS